MAVLCSLRQQVSLTTSHQLESIIDSWKTATAYASSRYRASQVLTSVCSLAACKSIIIARPGSVYQQVADSLPRLTCLLLWSVVLHT